MEQLSEKLKVDHVAADLGFDMRLEVILTRAEQLSRQEGTALLETKTQIYSLQRKVLTFSYTIHLFIILLIYFKCIQCKTSVKMQKSFNIKSK